MSNIINNSSSNLEIESKFIDYLETLLGYYQMFYSLGDSIEMIVDNDKTSAILKTPTIVAILANASDNDRLFKLLNILEIDATGNIVTSKYSIKNTSQLSKKVGKHFKNNLENVHKIEKLYS